MTNFAMRLSRQSARIKATVEANCQGSGHFGPVSRRYQAGNDMGMAACATHRFRGRLDDAPSLWIGHQCRQNGMVQPVPTANGLVSGEERLTCERQVANGIEDLVADKFVCKPQALGIEHPVPADD